MTASPSKSTEPFRVPSGRRVAGEVRVPPSKSWTHRAYAIALLADERTTVREPLEAEDTDLFLAALQKLDYGVSRTASIVTILPPTKRPAETALDCGNAGTLLRFLTALATVLPGRHRLDGTKRLRERPIGALVGALRGLGARIDFAAREGYAPLVVEGRTLVGGRARLDSSESSQFLSALLLAGQRAVSEIEIEAVGLVSAPYVELTISLLQAHGGSVDRNPGPDRSERFTTYPSLVSGGEIAIEADLSAAAYPAAAAALTGGRVLLRNVRLASKQGDRRLLEVLREMGARVAETPRGVVVEGAGLSGLDVDASDIPDQVPTLAAIAPFARGSTRIRNATHLRLKESDRLSAMATELRRAGAEVTERIDGLEIEGTWSAARPPEDPVEIDSHDDHRIAMAMTLVGLRRPNLSILQPDVVAKSYPRFFVDLEALLSVHGGRS